MNRPPDDEADPPLYEPDEGASYSLEIIARMSGVTTEAIIHYQEQGLIPTPPEDSSEQAFDDETLHTLRRIDHLRRTYEVNDAALRLILDLMDELERLRVDQSSQR